MIFKVTTTPLYGSHYNTCTYVKCDLSHLQGNVMECLCFQYLVKTHLRLPDGLDSIFLIIQNNALLYYSRFGT